MIQSRFFRRHFLIASALILTVVVLGLLTSYVVDTIARPEVERRSPPALYARLVHRLGNGDPVAGVRAIQDLVGPASSLRLTLLGPDGEVLYPEGAALSLPEFSLEELDQPFAGTVVRPPSP